MKLFKAAPVLRNLIAAPRPYSLSRTLGARTIAIIFVVIHCCVLVDLARGQELAAPAFYPLAVGNYWVYLDEFGGSVQDSIVVEAYGDTLIGDTSWIRMHRTSHRYQSHGYWEERIDSAGDVWWRGDQAPILMYRLSDTSATFWQSGERIARFDSCVAGEYIGVTGKILYVNYWRPGDTAARSVRALGEHIGFLYWGPYGLFDGSIERLAGAWIDGKGYGILATETTLDSASLAYYPLHVGDRWVYRTHSTWSSYSRIITVDVVGDTTLSSGLRYYIITREPALTQYGRFLERVDSATGILYHIDPYDDEEQLYDSLAAMAGDTVYSMRQGAGYMFCTELVTDTVLGLFTSMKSFWIPLVGSDPWYRLAQGLGLVWYSERIEHGSYPIYGSYDEILVYAKIDGREYGAMEGVEPVTVIRPNEYVLGQNYPNPFNPSTTIRYGLPTRSYVTLTVFNTLGQQVATLIQGEQDAGYHEAVFDASGLASGVYLYRLQAGDFTQTLRLMVLR